MRPRSGAIPRLGGALALLGLATPPLAATLPNGFVHEQVLFSPFTGGTVGFAFLPDGRILLVERESGVVRLAAAGASTSDSIATIEGVRADHPERGLLGVAVDPDWPLRPYLYFQLNHTSGFERVEMLTAAGALSDPASTSIALGSPYVLLGEIADVNGIHNGGTLRFGPDGLLYASVGEDGTPCASQDVARPNGKLLRLDVSRMPGEGTGPPPLADLAPPDNPLPDAPGCAPLVYAWGLRNPFRFTIDAPTADVFVADVGQSAYDEIDLIPGTGYRGWNFGWPMFDGSLRILCCDSCNVGAFVAPAIHLVPNLPESLLAVTGGPVSRAVPSSPISFPASLDGDYFYFEFFAGTLHRLRAIDGKWRFAPPLPGQPNETTFGAGFPSVTDAQEGPDGALYFTSLGFDEPVLPRGLHRIRAGGDGRANGVPAASRARGGEGVRVVPNPVRSTTAIHVAAGGTVEIVNAAGARVRVFERTEATSGATTIVWDGRDDAGREVPAGVYLVRVLSPSGDVAGSGKVTRLR